jgi:hypothetical protein
MNWNSPVADEVFAFAPGSSADSRCAVASRYSKPVPVFSAPSRIAFTTGLAGAVSRATGVVNRNIRKTLKQNPYFLEIEPFMVKEA